MLSTIGLLGVLLVALMSPGPDFAIVVKNSLIYSRKAGILTACGVALGNAFHVMLVVLGLGIIIKKSIILITIMKTLGGSYLIYLGIRGILATKSTNSSVIGNTENGIPKHKILVRGLLKSMLNPKAMLFYLGLFSTAIKDDTNTSTMIIWIIIVFVEAFIWFSIVALCFSNSILRMKFISIGHWIERVTGVLLTALGIKLLFTKLTD
jgi:RhtB (resistance to homoserine/threonine) family protein